MPHRFSRTRPNFLFYILVVFFTACANLIAPLARAVEPRFLPNAARLVASQRARDFLVSGKDRDGNPIELRDFEVDGLVAVQVALAEAILHLTSDHATNESLERLKKLLTRAKRWAWEQDLEADPALGQAIRRQASILLAELPPTSSHSKSVVALFDTLNMWAPENFWFFQRASTNTRILAQHHFRIRPLLTEIDQKTMATFVNNLRMVKPYDQVALSLLFDTGLIRSVELEKYLQLIADQFVLNSNPDYLRAHQIDPYFVIEMEIIDQTLANFRRAYRAQDPKARLAYDGARMISSRNADSRRYELRTKFFRLLVNEHFRWNDLTTWNENPPLPSPTAPLKMGNVITVDFTRRSCAKDLED